MRTWAWCAAFLLAMGLAGALYLRGDVPVEERPVTVVTYLEEP